MGSGKAKEVTLKPKEEVDKKLQDLKEELGRSKVIEEQPTKT